MSSVTASVSPARRAAFSILMAMERGQPHSDDLLRGKSIDALSGVDRHLATALVLGVLRWQIQLDEQVRKYLKRPGAKLDPQVRIALRLGAFQLLHLDRIPSHAAIGESVELTRQSGHRFASGMVNAVLRKLSTVPKAGAAANDFPPDDLAAAYAHPGWMVERWVHLFGHERARALCQHDQAAPALTVRLAAADVEKELLDARITLAPAAILTSARTVTAGDLMGSDALREGRVRIQDEGSQLVGEIAAAAGARDVNSILDCCAAPGGKTLILAERFAEARITACESNEPRLERLRERLALLGSRVSCRVADATALDYESGFEVVLADVPCSGTGTLSRNPEIRHRLRADELPRQAERQGAILLSALRAVRPGGHVVYSTCSLEPEENEQVLATILSERRDARVVPPGAAIDAMRAHGVVHTTAADRLRGSITSDGYLRLFPDTFGTDGFFIAVLQRGE